MAGATPLAFTQEDCLVFVIYRLDGLLPLCKGFFRFTSGVTPAALKLRVFGSYGSALSFVRSVPSAAQYMFE